MPKFGWVVCILRDIYRRILLVSFKPLNAHHLPETSRWHDKAERSGGLKLLDAIQAISPRLMLLQHFGVRTGL